MRKADFADLEAERLFDLVAEGCTDEYVTERIAIALRRAVLMPARLRRLVVITGPVDFTPPVGAPECDDGGKAP